MFRPPAIVQSNFQFQPCSNQPTRGSSFVHCNVQAATQPRDHHSGVVAFGSHICSAASVPQLSSIKQSKPNCVQTTALSFIRVFNECCQESIRSENIVCEHATEFNLHQACRSWNAVTSLGWRGNSQSPKNERSSRSHLGSSQREGPA